MIIPRKYEWLGILYERDPESRKLIDEAFELANKDESWKAKLLDYNYCNIPAFLNLGCGIPGNSYTYMIKGFSELDKVQQYENELSFKDVTDVEYETSRKGNAIQMRLVNQRSESPYRIVGFVAIENTNATMRIIDCWEMMQPFTVG